MIREAIADTWPGQTDAPLMLAAFEQVATSAQNARESVEDWCIEALRFLYQKQVEIGDYAGAMRAISDLHKLATKHAKQTTSSEDFPRVLDVGDRRKQLAERIARIG